MPQPFAAIPGPKGFPLIGSLLDYSRFGKYSFERMHIAKRENYERYGSIYMEKIGRHIVNLFDPADIEKVYRTEGKYPIRPPFPLPIVAWKRDKEPIGFGSLNGEPWWRVRKAVHGTMMPPGAALVYLPIQNQVADDLIRLISLRITKGTNGELNEDITQFLSNYTMEAFGAVCFNVRIGCLEPTIPVDSEVSRLITSTSRMFQALQKTTFAFPSYAIYRTKLYKQFLSSMNVCNSIAKTYVDAALSANGDQPKTNFLQTLVENNSERLTTDEMVRLTIDLFTAGIDSTANALSFCLYNLAANADKQELLIAELDSVLGRCSDQTPPSSVTPDGLNQMHYLKACVKESFRLNFPIEGGPVRELTTDLVLSDYHVPKGTLVSPNYQTMCLLEKYFEQSGSYIPERWLKDGGDTLRPVPNFVMLPFGYGPRMCIGRRFAEQEIYLALVKVFQRFRVKLASKSGDCPRVGMINRVFTIPDAPIPIRFIPR